MQKNRIKLIERIKYYLKGYTVSKKLSTYAHSFISGLGPLHSFNKDAFAICKAGKIVTIVDINNKEIIPQGTYAAIDSTDKIFILYNYETKRLEAYTYSGEMIYACKASGSSSYHRIDSVIYETRPIRESTLTFFNEETSTFDFLNTDGSLLISDIQGYSSYHGIENYILFVYTKNDKTFIMFNHNEIMKAECVIDLNKFFLPLCACIESKKEKGILEKYFITEAGTLLPYPFKKIEYAGDKICWRVENKDGMKNYITPSGFILLERWAMDITRFHNGFAFVKMSSGEFYEMIDTKGNIIPNNSDIKIRTVETGFRNVFINGKTGVYALVNVREAFPTGFNEQGEKVVYEDYQCFVDRNYNFYKFDEA